MPINSSKRRERQILAAEGYLALNMPDHALRELGHIEDVGDERYNVSMLHGEALLMKGEMQPALDDFREAHKEKPTELNALMRMAWCYKRVDQLPRAIDAMKLAYQFHKDVPVVLYNLACYYSLAGEKFEALSWLGRAFRMDRELLKLVPRETDFDPLRNDLDFQHLMALTSSQK
ncbi:tetratricopeptide repeat protein [Schlesneria sp.]|uniref:tetratricopeptide repeat protein n=1 Tax=Schlesneria sp. TaxID=2762018 RepID=UPI002EDCD22E